eukprot:466858_1
MSTELTVANGENIPFTFVRKSSIDSYDASMFSPTSKLVYKQWKVDANDELLIDGYFRECNVTIQHLPSDIKKTIGSYYQKMHSKSKLKELYETNKQRIMAIKKWQRELRKKKCLSLLLFFMYLIITVFILTYAFAPAIVGLLIANKNDCNLAVDTISGSNINMFLYVGCGVHFFCMSLLLLSSAINWLCPEAPDNCKYIDHNLWIKCWKCRQDIIGGCVAGLWAVFVMMYSIVGFLLYSTMDQSTVSNKQCADIVISLSTIYFASLWLNLFCFVVCDFNFLSY